MWTNENAKQRGAGGRYFWTNTATPKQFFSMNAKWTARQKKKVLLAETSNARWRSVRTTSDAKGDKKKKKFSGQTREGAHHRAYVHDSYRLCVVIRIKKQFFTAYLYVLSILL